jgi:DNA-binding response OmpR family regulator
MRLLCLDDDADLRTILRLALALDPGIDADVKGDPASFLATASEESWDAFMVDLLLPGTDGLAVCRSLKADDRTRAVPVLLLTASRTPDMLQRARDAGAVDCLEKPFDPLTLAAAVRTALAAR